MFAAISVLKIEMSIIVTFAATFRVKCNQPELNDRQTQEVTAPFSHVSSRCSGMTHRTCKALDRSAIEAGPGII